MIKPFKYESFSDFKNLTSENVKKIESWIKEYDSIKNLNLMKEKILMITGDSNTLKTNLAKFICENYGFSTRLLNIHDNKINKDIREFILQISNNKNVLSMIYNKEEKIAIIIDDFDALLTNNDKNVINDFMTLFNLRKKQKNDLKLMYPIIVVCQDISDKKVNDLKKIACHINLGKLRENDCNYYFDRILDINNISLTKKQKDRMLKVMDRDIRKYNYILDDILMISKGTIKDRDIDFVLDTFSGKSGDEKLSENLEKIFTQELTVKDNINMYFGDKFLFSFEIHENYPYNMGKKLKNNDKLYLLASTSEDLANNDVVQNLIFEKQLWDLNINSAILTNLNTNFRHRRVIGKNKIDFVRRKYTTLLNKVSLYYTNRKVINSVMHKYGNNTNDALILSEFICDILKEIDKKELESEMERYLFPILKRLDMTSDDVDLLIRLNKLDDEDIKKVYTTRYKNIVKNLGEVY